MDMGWEEEKEAEEGGVVFIPKIERLKWAFLPLAVLLVAKVPLCRRGRP